MVLHHDAATTSATSRWCMGRVGTSRWCYITMLRQQVLHHDGVWVGLLHHAGATSRWCVGRVGTSRWSYITLVLHHNGATSQWCVGRVGQMTVYVYTVYDRINGDFLAKNTAYTSYIYGSGQP